MFKNSEEKTTQLDQISVVREKSLDWITCLGTMACVNVNRFAVLWTRGVFGLPELRLARGKFIPKSFRKFGSISVIG